MAVVPSKDTDRFLTIQECKGFMEDSRFALTRETSIQSGRAVGLPSKVMQSLVTPSHLPGVSPQTDSVFFHNDRFELIIDARGYSPQDIKCSITPCNVEVYAQAHDKQATSERSMTMSRSYQLPQLVIPERGNCLLSAEGILVINAPWKT